MIWKQTIDLESLQVAQKNTMSEWLGIKFLEIGPDFLKASMPLSPRTRQPAGILHGGASVALAETLGSLAAHFTIDDHRKSYVVGVEINANHVRPVKDGEVIAEVKPIKVGKKLQVWSIEITQAEKMVCVSRLTTMVLDH